MVDVLDPMLPDTEVPEAELPDDERAPQRDWWRWAPYLMVAAAVGFTAWVLRSELHAVPYANDSAVHTSLTQFAAERIRAGHSPFDAWYPYLGLGSPQFLQYQTLSHIFTGVLSIVFGDAAFRWTQYLLICTWPVTVYIGARLFGLDRWQAGVAALLSPSISNITGYGFEWGSFIWIGTGLWSMLWALWLLPIALGLGWRAVAYKERIALAAFVVGLTCALHFVTGYLVLLALGVFIVLRPPDFVMRLGRSAVVGLGGLLVFAFVFAPTLSGIKYANLDSFQVHTFWVDSYGPVKVLGWLFRGEMFDFTRVPIVSLLVLVGGIVSLLRAPKSETARAPIALFVLSLLLYCGRSVVGPVIDVLPAGNRILLHRYVIGVHFAGLLLAGVGAVWLFRTLVDGARRVPRLDRHLAVVAVAAVAIIGVLITPVAVNRYRLGNANAFLRSHQTIAQGAEGRNLDALMDMVRKRNDGRVYAGATDETGKQGRLYITPLWILPDQVQTDSLGFNLRTDSLSADIEPFFDGTKLAQYDLFNVKYLLLPAEGKPPIRQATLLARRGDYALYQVETSGYLEVVDATDSVAANQGNMAKVMRPYLKSRAVAELRHPLVAFAGKSTPEPSLSSDAPYTGPPGRVDHSSVDFENARFAGEVHASRPAWVMLKESYYPHWTATVDGHPVKPQMLAPSFMGVPVPAGDHEVAFQYRPTHEYPIYLAIGVLTLLALIFVPVVWRRRRRGRSEAEPAAVSAPTAD
jgi:hypothetical protein